MAHKNYLFTSESVSEGHPDKVCDQISDAVLDAFLENDMKLGIDDDSLVNTRLGCETLTTTNKIVIAGEGRGQSPLFKKYGSQAVITAIDAKLADSGRYEVFARSGRTPAGREAAEWAREAADRGAGEILLTSIDRDGTRQGYDCALTAAVAEAVPIPVIASGGAGTFDHFHDVFTRGRADAALAASVFHFSEHAVSELKTFLRDRGVPVRL